MIARLWRGWTSQANADAYEALLRTRIFPAILGRGVGGFRRIELLRRDLGDEVEFVTVMWFDTLEAVKEFAGASWEEAVVPAAAREVLAHFDAKSAHYEMRAAETP